MKNLVVHLKTKHYNMILEGKKNTEFREYKKFWKNRIKGKYLDEIILYNAYTKDYIKAFIDDIRVFHYSELPFYAQKEFKKSNKNYFFGIIFSIYEFSNSKDFLKYLDCV